MSVSDPKTAAKPHLVKEAASFIRVSLLINLALPTDSNTQQDHSYHPAGFETGFSSVDQVPVSAFETLNSKFASRSPKGGKFPSSVYCVVAQTSIFVCILLC